MAVKEARVMKERQVHLEMGDEGRPHVPEMLEREVSIHSRLSHSNIVAFLGTDMLADKMHIFLEYMSCGSLYHLLQTRGPLQELKTASYAQQVLEGVHYLHTRKPSVLHRDLKTANILLGPNGVVKLADFGCAKRVSGTAMHTLRGSVQWMAPEVLNQQPYGKTADIWSFGCVLVEMITGKAPWGQFETSIAAMIHVATVQVLPPLPEHVA
ncbi:ANP1 [Symbiodinium natans]|uniref:ANP1 protein n=1 Tax=Symbiodinium natans TaxID=878477 RepID=A0A812QKB3_9DINO|nr:ANP1 [Symbiodinium natans]